MKRNVWHIRIHTGPATTTRLIYMYLVVLHFVPLPGDRIDDTNEPTRAYIDEYTHLH